MARASRYDFETGQTDPHYPVGWDDDCVLVARFEYPPSDPPTDRAPEEQRDADDEPTEPSNKRAKTAAEGDAALWTAYKPRVLGTFSLDLSNLDASPPLRYTATLVPRIITPGVAPMYSAPTLPLRISTHGSRGKGSSSRVTKPPLSTLLHVAQRSGLLVGGAALPGCEGLTFVMYRHSLQSMLEARAGAWRVDVQRCGRVVLLRRFLDYSWEEVNDVGHSFEKACTQDPPGEGERSGFRALITGHVGPHTLVTSCEIDAVQPPPPSPSSPLTVAQLLELKTAFAAPPAGRVNAKTRAWWVQSFFGGVQRVLLGVKKDAGAGVVDVAEVRELKVDDMAAEEDKAAVMRRLHALLSFMHDAVEEGRLYKLVKEKLPEGTGYRVALHEVRGGLDTWPVWREGGIQQPTEVPPAAEAEAEEQQKKEKEEEHGEPKEDGDDSAAAVAEA